MPERLQALLEVESGLNDPMSVFLTFLLMHLIGEPASVGAGDAVLILLARPAAVLVCLPPFRFSPREIAFASWVGLRGAVRIYLSIILGLADPQRDERLFASIFILVIASLLVQGWTVAPAARLLGFARAAPAHR